MHKRFALPWLAGSVILFLGATPRLQRPDDAAIVRAAYTLLKPELGPGSVLIDLGAISAQPELADEIAREFGAVHGRARDSIQCSNGEPGRRPVCSIVGHKSLVEFSRPAMSDGSATITVTWRRQVVAGMISTDWIKLEVGRASGGTWAVRRVITRERT